MLRLILLTTLLGLSLSPSVFANARVSSWCEVGAKVVVTGGVNASTPKVQASYPVCNVTVYLTGTLTKATIYSDNLASPTPLANPFQATNLGYWGFYIPDGVYDVLISGGGLATPFTFGAINTIDYYFESIQGGLTGPNARSKNAKLADSIQVTDYGADPTGSADSTSAISAAITAVQSWPTQAANSPPPCIHFAAGTYKVSTSNPQVFHITFSNLCIYGDGPWNTTITTVSGSTIIFNIGTFNATQYPPYVSNANGFSISNIRLVNTNQLALTNTGSRTTVGVQSNGNSFVEMENVQCEGLQYCFAGPYGANFARFRKVWSDQNDVGIYLGPASQQCSILEFESGASGEGIVMDGANSNQVLNSTFEDSMTADVTFENERPTRMGWEESSMLGDPEFSDTLQGLWLETGSGSGYSTWQEYVRIRMITNQMDLSYPRHIIMRDLYFVLGSAGIAAQDGNPHPLIECDSCRFISAENLTILGNRWTTGVFMNGGNAFALDNFIIEDGFTQSTPLFTFNNTTSFGSESSYVSKFLNKSFEPIPTSCSEGDGLFYDYTNTNWAGCTNATGMGAAYTYFAQLDTNFLIPVSLLPTNPSFSSLVINGSKTGVNAVQATVYAGNTSSNNGWWWFQNALNPVGTIVLAGYNPAGQPVLTLSPVTNSLGATAVSEIKSQAYLSTGTTFANLGTPGVGTFIYCTNCTIGATCTGSGTGAWAFRTGSAAWTCPF